VYKFKDSDDLATSFLA